MLAWNCTILPQSFDRQPQVVTLRIDTYIQYIVILYVYILIQFPFPIK